MNILTQLVFLMTIALNGNIITNSTGYIPGDKASDFSLKSVDGKSYSLSNYKDAKGFIIVFTCNSCPFAVMYEDRINDLAKKYVTKGYVLLAINPNDPTVKPDDSYLMMQQRTKEKRFVFPYLFDEGQKVYPVFGATKTPHVFLLDGNHVVKYVGAIDNNAEDATQVSEKYLENAILALEKGVEPNPASTRAIGCSIKVKK